MLGSLPVAQGTGERCTRLSPCRPLFSLPSPAWSLRPPPRQAAPLSTWVPMDMLWAMSKGLMKGVLCELSHSCRCRTASEWHCSSFREQKSQRAQVAVCRRPRLSQTWGRSMVDRLRLRHFQPRRAVPEECLRIKALPKASLAFLPAPSPKAPPGPLLSALTLHPLG